jgi:DNA-binding MarR family transcriptional regulator
MYRPFLDELGITYPQYLALLVLWEQKKCSVKELGERLYLDSGTLTPMLKRMEAAQLIKRNRCMDDERKVIVHLTKQGELLKEKAKCIPEALLRNSGIHQEDFLHLLKQLKRLLRHVHDLNK